ncbi:MAG TPA: ribonuclease H-like domain-containing protein [Bryobacteraceae bacterium]|nr:ribonuclease H-like domain-containing protein [Bryobacteraceae bacterium]
MSELQEQLAALRRRMARTLEECALKYEKPGFTALSQPFASGIGSYLEESAGVAGSAPGGNGLDPRRQSAGNRFHVEEWLPGEEVETALGRHYETETFYARHRHHGTADIGALAELPANLLEILADDAVRDIPPTEWAFLDTETTGLAGGTGTCAFLIGVGRIISEGFHVRQFFMRDYGEEASSLDALTRYLAPFRVLITYNGRSFDQPLLETRYRMNRARPPFGRLEHVDLLYGARRLWKLRFESCRLVDLEQSILGVERQGDAPGALIPYLYFEYLRTHEIARLVPVFHHNATDILTLACLAGIVPAAFNNAFNDPSSAPLRHGAEMASVARWLREAGELDQARTLFRRAMNAELRDDLLFRTLWDLAALEKKLECDAAALEIWSDLAGSKNPFQVKAHEELAKYFEHSAKNYARALELTRAALDLDDSEELRKREQRLMRRVASASISPASGMKASSRQKTERPKQLLRG